jgi:hypothetical protein
LVREGPTDEQELADDELTEGRTEELADEGPTGKGMIGKVLKRLNRQKQKKAADRRRNNRID